jgi:hypothetical protein
MVTTMASRSEFSKRLAQQDEQHIDRAIALLWYYHVTEEFEERSPSDLSYDLHEDGFPKPNVTRLEKELKKISYTIVGRRNGTFQIDIRRLAELDRKYRPLLNIKDVKVEDNILPSEWVAGTRGYLERMVLQINGASQFGFLDCCAVLCRRLMESLIIEIYISQGRQQEIQVGGVFYGLDKLISYVVADKKVTLGRNSHSTMNDIKLIGDTAAHDRAYITQPVDLDDHIKARYRRLILELLTISGIKK